MKRKHLFEFEDLEWFPSSVRNCGTDFLQFICNQFDFYKEVVPIIAKGIEKSKTTQVIDLASGGGGGWKTLAKRIQHQIPEVKILLTDYYPNLEAFKERVKENPAIFDYSEMPINSLNVPPHLKGLRTQFLSFHHFRPEDARQILQNAVDCKAPIAIFEAQERDAAHFIKNMFSPLSILLTTPFIRPFKWKRLAFTYLIPVVPLFVLWDGVVSVLRTYSVEEMKAMVTGLNRGDSFLWEIGRRKNGPITILYLLGYPKDV